MNVAAAADGTQFIVNNDWIVTADGRYPEYELVEWARQFLSPELVLVDIGAHMGTYSLSLARGPGAAQHVFAFEAQRGTFNQLAGGIALNGLSDRVTAAHCGIGAVSGSQRTLRVVSHDGGGSSFETGQLPVLSEERVNMWTLDDFQLPNNIGLIKIDVEGMELDCIMGAARTLERAGFPAILFEAWPDEWFAEKKASLFDHLKQIGYAVHPIAGTNHMFLASDHTSSRPRK